MSNHWVAFSGGMDSHVLLHFLKYNFPELHIKAIHINHQLLPHAHAWEKHCQNICRALNVPLKIIRVSISQTSNLEATARNARYTAFKKIIKHNDVLFTAHHLDDQAETFLFQLLRGAGLKGVSAMPKLSSLGKGWLARPFLAFSREDLKNYADDYNLAFIDDPSNTDERFDRNYLRHAIFPLLKKRWPHVLKTFSRFASYAVEQESLLMSLAEKDVQELFHTLSLARQKNVIRYLIQQHQFEMPSEKILNEIVKMHRARADKNPIVKWGNYECRRYQGKLYFLNNAIEQKTLTKKEIAWCKKHSINLATVDVKYRKGGEKFKSKTVKNLFQEWKIPPWERDRIPLLYKDNKLIAIVGYAVL